MADCPTCVALPVLLAKRGVLYIAPPLGHTESKLVAYLSERQIDYDRPLPGVLSMQFNEDLRPILIELPAKLSDVELEDSRCLVSESLDSFTLKDALAMKSLRSLIANLQGAWLRKIIEENRFVSHFQPICNCIDPSDVFAYECLLRGKNEDGGLISPQKLYDLARELGIMFQLDRAARLQHIDAARAAEIATNIFINFNPTAIYDPTFCLQSTMQAIRDSGIPPRQFVFEVVESDEVDVARLTTILDYYRERGFRVALDDFGAGYGSVNLLTRLRPDFVKLDRELVREIDRDAYKSQIVSHVIAMSHDVGVEVVFEGVETHAEWQWAIEHHADYVQGYFIAKPAPTPPMPSLDKLGLIAV